MLLIVKVDFLYLYEMRLSKTEKIDKKIFVNIFSDNWEDFKNQHPSYADSQYEDPIQKMLGCGKESNGYSEHICMDCGQDIRRIAFSCKSGFCLSCAKKYVDDFVSQVSNMLHPGVTYRHIVLTIPEQLRIIFYRHRHDGSLLSMFMKIGHECLEDVVSTVKRLLLKIGCIVVVQTHGRSGRYNPHLHIIMTSGGIDTGTERWVDLGYFNYEIIHKKWQYHLFGALKEFFSCSKINQLISELWKKYPNGLVANVSKGDVPNNCKGLARYLAKYVASPPIAVRRIVSYDGETITYWYQDHETRSKKFERVDVFTFIGRMVQHIMPKNFHRVRYYGLESTKSFKKWAKVITQGIKKLGRVVKGVYEIVTKKKYSERYEKISGHDPMKCRCCGGRMELWKIWHPKYGLIYDESENIKSGKYELYPTRFDEGRGGRPIRSSTGGVQLSLFTLLS